MTTIYEAIEGFIKDHPEMGRDEVEWFIVEKTDEALRNNGLDEEEEGD